MRSAAKDPPPPKMAPTVGSERADMARIGPGGLALLPWTRQMLTVLWTQIRLLLQVIYYTFISGKSPLRVRVSTRGSGPKLGRNSVRELSSPCCLLLLLTQALLSLLNVPYKQHKVM